MGNMNSNSTVELTFPTTDLKKDTRSLKNRRRIWQGNSRGKKIRCQERNAIIQFTIETAKARPEKLTKNNVVTEHSYLFKRKVNFSCLKTSHDYLLTSMTLTKLSKTCNHLSKTQNYKNKHTETVHGQFKYSSYQQRACRYKELKDKARCITIVP